jgi:SAM-dependent methyltransferase
MDGVAKTNRKEMIYTKLKRRINKITQLGLSSVFMCYFTRRKFKLLWERYKFDPWHCEGTYYCRPYQRIAVEMINRVHPETVVEIGCGLGEIISRVNANIKFGYDQEGAVIEAAKEIRGQKVNFRLGSGDDIIKTNIDVLVAINWIHNLSPDEMEQLIASLIDRVSYFLLEAITPGEPGYRFYHDFSFLNGRAVLVDAAPGGIGEPRTLMLFKKI